jgi:hypothetical protein
MCNRCGNFDNWNNVTNCCSCGCKQRKGDKGEPGIQGKTGAFPANVFSVVPLMTASQISAYPNPSAGLVVFNTTTNQFYGYTTSWNPLGTGVSSSINTYSAHLTRLGVTGNGTTTVTTTFLPKLIHITAGQNPISGISVGSIGRSNGTNNSCYSNFFSGGSFSFANDVYCARILDSSNHGYNIIINNFTATSFDVVYAVATSGIDIQLYIDVIG